MTAAAAAPSASTPNLENQKAEPPEVEPEKKSEAAVDEQPHKDQPDEAEELARPNANLVPKPEENQESLASEDSSSDGPPWELADQSTIDAEPSDHTAEKDEPNVPKFSPEAHDEVDQEQDASVVVVEELTETAEDHDQSTSENQGVADNQEAPQSLETLNTDTWIPLYRQLPLDGVVKSVVSHMVLEHNQLGSLLFRLAESGQPLFNANHKQRLADCLTTHFGSPVEIEVELGGVQRETPAENARRLHREAITAAEKEMLDNPLIQEMIREFQAELVPDSVVICDGEK